MADEYKKSSFCILGGCLEVKVDRNGVRVRRSNDKESVIRVSLNEWIAFVKAVKAGEFDTE